MIGWVSKRANKYLSGQNLALNPDPGHLEALQNLKAALTPVHIAAILACLPEGLSEKSEAYTVYRDLKLTYATNNGELVTGSVLGLIFNYKAFRSYKASIYNGYTLAEQLGIDCCPYCNRHYTTTHHTYYVNDNGTAVEKRVFPEFDHFYPQKLHPVLALSFYNLIPSCTVCNTHYKNSRDSAHLFHPYTLHQHGAFRFTDFPKDVASLYGGGSAISIGFEYNCTDEMRIRLSNSKAFFGIKDIYDKCHGELIRDIIFKKIAFSKRYMEELAGAYTLTFEDAYKIVFECHFEDENVHKRPFSKLKKDIFESPDL
ncbi:hypothetical protein [Flavobacterium beibuense]|nr:hypothetical protein [Flavobacterium beibuense]